ncbi:uncharacterized protein LOC141693951 [Apium graveolens]|uniref:uncharacterized protein LOC141693951 n=1 Tax=Apium graveolens TaxID=4045 RepID=UPI003D79B13A
MYYIHSVKQNKIMLRYIILFISTLAASSTCRNSGAATGLNNVTDQQALLSVKAYITGDPNGVLSSWNHSIHFCEWKGITCSHRHERVTKLDLSSQKLDGTMSPYIGNFSFLRVLYLDVNNFRGSIPGEIGKLFRLRYLYLGSNSFQGGFPMNLTHCTDIRHIHLAGNNLGGKLPADFTLWSKLVVFSTRINSFTGDIPSSIGNMSSLTSFDIARNNITGNIPLEIAQLLKLQHLQLALNNLLGTVPPQIYNISSLTFVSLTGNGLQGRLPADLFSSLFKMKSFFASDNQFSGPLPPSIINASKLVGFDIGGNNFTGPLPINLGGLLSLERLGLGNNQLGYNQQPGDLRFLSSLANCTRLKQLGLFSAGLIGKIPNSIANFSTTLNYLGFSGNYIYGSIPKEIGKLFNLNYLSMDVNMLTRDIPESICKLSKLEKLFLSHNNISGVIPACISNITGLLIFSMGQNLLHGSIPTALFNMTALLGINLFNNYLNGVISGIGLSSQCFALYLDQNLLTGPLPSNIGSFKHLTTLRLSNNKLIGDIPTSLGDCVMLEELLMDGNLFNGKIPNSFKHLKNLAFLDLSNNTMSGNIPNFLGELVQIQFLNLSYNKFEGEVSKKGKFSNVSAFSVVGNFQLCGGIQALKLPACPTNISEAKNNHLPLRMILLLVLLPLATLLACFTFVFYRMKSKKKEVEALVLQGDQYPRISYQDLLLATNNFSPENLLGEGRYGSVFKGNLESLQQIVAVKVLNVVVQGSDKNFLSECHMLRNIRHRNIIKIITVCSSTDFKGNDFKALVLEFMTNGSLDNWLHPSPSDQGNERNLTLFQRLNISIDVALAVDYMQHQCHTKVIHCDIKPSNVLLDEDFVARVGDFGLARFFQTSASDINQAQSSTTAVGGTVGYVPPEYGMGGRISAEGDVYSYGILLLEMFTAQRPRGSGMLMEDADNLHGYVRNALPQRIMEIADPRITLEADSESLRLELGSRSSISSRMEVCLASVFEVGVLCSVERPQERIDISVAIKMLQVARDKLMR